MAVDKREQLSHVQRATAHTYIHTDDSNIRYEGISGKLTNVHRHDNLGCSELGIRGSRRGVRSTSAKNCSKLIPAKTISWFVT